MSEIDNKIKAYTLKVQNEDVRQGFSVGKTSGLEIGEYREALKRTLDKFLSPKERNYTVARLHNVFIGFQLGKEYKQLVENGMADNNWGIIDDLSRTIGRGNIPKPPPTSIKKTAALGWVNREVQAAFNKGEYWSVAPNGTIMHSNGKGPVSAEDQKNYLRGLVDDSVEPSKNIQNKMPVKPGF